MRLELASLLAAADAAGVFLEERVVVPSGPDETADHLPVGTVLGHWRLLRLLGQGGMGDVYLAERIAGDFEQRVALKVTRRESAMHQGRMTVERQLLAQLDHRGIVRLFDGGTTPDGRPFFVMECIEGRPIVEYCDSVKANLGERLALFLQVCDAVAYAHRHLIVHRDIKPANVLVDAEGRARLLDFGIAKPLDLGVAPSGTAAGVTGMLLTPDYAAPEQLAGEPVTTATDVHALGVLLFELLTGRRPWAVAGQPAVRALLALLERPAPRPSAVASMTPERPVAARLLRGDMDAIVAKCLRREPQQRYATVEALKLDIERSQRGDTVLARGDEAWHQVGRIVRRYRWAVASVAAVIAALGIGISTTLWQARRAEAEAARAAATRDFLVGVFKASDPRIAQDKPRGQVTAKELLDASVMRIDAEFDDDPATRIELLGIASEIYRELDEAGRHGQLQRRHLALALSHYGASDPRVLGLRLDAAAAAKDRLDGPEALRLLAALDPAIREAGLDRSPLRARWWLIRGQALMDDSSRKEEQLVAMKAAVALFAAVAPGDPARVTALADLGTIHNNHMEFADARRYYEEAIAVSRTVAKRDDSELATIHGNLGLQLFSLGDFAAAERAYAQSAEIIRRTYGESHPRHWLHASNRARAAHLAGDRERADGLFAALFRNVPADSDHVSALEAREWYAACLAAEGRPQEAVPILEAVELRYRTHAPYDYALPRVRLTLGDAYDRAGRPGEARAMLAAALEQRLAASARDSQVVFAARERYGRLLLAQGDRAGAEAQFEEIIGQAHGRRLAHVALAHGGMARAALARGDLAGARASSETAVRLMGEVTGFRDVRMGPTLWLVHSEALRRSGDLAGARLWAERALLARRRYDHPGAASIIEAEAAVAAARA